MIITKKTDLKTLAEHFMKNRGCAGVDCEFECPLAAVNLTMKSSICTVNPEQRQLISTSKKWAEEYLKLKYLEAL
jgi:hypothetical protein